MSNFKVLKTTHRKITKVIPVKVKGKVNEHDFVRQYKKNIKKSPVMIYTDGSYSHKEERGGWSAVFLKGDKIYDYNGTNDIYAHFSENIECLVGGRRQHSNLEIVRKNYPALMELTAVVMAVKQVKTPSHIHIMTDNAAYVLTNISNIDKIIAREKKRQMSEAVALWRELKEAIQTYGHDVTIQHVYGHKGLVGNELADKLAKYGSANLGNKDRHTYLHLKPEQVDMNIKHTFEIDINRKSDFRTQLQNTLNGISKELQHHMNEGGVASTKFISKKNGKHYIQVEIKGSLEKNNAHNKPLIKYNTILNKVITRFGSIERTAKIQLFNTLYEGLIKPAVLDLHLKKGSGKKVFVNQKARVNLLSSNKDVKKKEFEQKINCHQSAGFEAN